MFPRVAILAPQSGTLKQCFYCSGKLPARNKEHIFNACWGGHHKTSQLICDDCNTAFSKIDAAMAPWTQFVMNAWRVKGERQKAIPTIPLQGDYDVSPGGKPKLRRPLLDVKSQPGSHEISLEASSKSEARRILLDGELEQRIGRELTEEERERFLQQISQTQSEKVFVSGRHHAHLRVADEYRSIAHTALKCAAMYDPSLVSHPVTAAVREFARYGTGSWDAFAVTVTQHVSLLVGVPRGFGNLFNAVEIYWSRSLGKIIAVVTVLGEITRAVILGECDCPDATLAVIEPACQPGEFKNFFAQFDETAVPLPLLEIKTFPVTMDVIEREFAVFAGNTISIDTVVAGFYSGLSGLVQKFPEVKPELIEQLRQLLVEFVQSIARSTGRTVSAGEVAATLDEAGFTKLENELGKSSVADDVQMLIGKAVLAALEKFSGPAGERNTGTPTA